MTFESVAGEKETPDGEGQDPPRAAEVPVQEGQQPRKTTRRKRRPKEPTPQLTNPACSNPACLVTCSPTCENLIDMQDYREQVRAEREYEMRNDPTLRSMDVMP